MITGLLWTLTFFYVVVAGYIRYKSTPWGSLVEWGSDVASAALLLALSGLAHVRPRPRHALPLAFLVPTYLLSGLVPLVLASQVYAGILMGLYLRTSSRPVVPVYLYGAGTALLAAEGLGVDIEALFFSLLFGALSTYSLAMGHISRTALVPLLSLAFSLAIARLGLAPLPSPSMGLLFVALGGAAVGSAVVGRGRIHAAHVPLLLLVPLLAYIYPYASGAAAYKLALVEPGAVVITGLPYPYPPSVGLMELSLGVVGVCGPEGPPTVAVRVNATVSIGATMVRVAGTYGVDDMLEGTFVVGGADVPWYMGDLRLVLFQPSYPVNTSAGEVLWGLLHSKVLEGLRRMCGDDVALRWTSEAVGRALSPGDLDVLAEAREAPWVIAFRPVPFLWLFLALSFILPFFLLYFAGRAAGHKA